MSTGIELIRFITCTIRRICCMRPVDDPHPWMVAVTGGSYYPPRGRKSTSRMKNPRVGWANNIEKGDEGYSTGRYKRLESLDYAERDMCIKYMDRVFIHGICPSIHGRGKNSTSRVQEIEHLRVNHVFFFGCLSDEKYILFLFLIFVYLILKFFLPSPFHGSGLLHSWIFRFEKSHKIKRYIIVLKCSFYPSQ